MQFPSIGAVASSLLTSKDLPLPGFIGVGHRPALGPGFLGMDYAPFTVQNPGQPPAKHRPARRSARTMEQEERLRRRQRLFNTVEDNFADDGTSPTLKAAEEARPPTRPGPRPSTRRAST